ncbi:hypothetical protein C8Q76DRAFT_251993 [Earliella scabrosa]|nr:hypothetical protein C8Q76DRAFT_251993 [Earliella scabrosa]
MNSISFTAHVSSLWRATTSDPTAIKDQKAFLNALKGEPDQPISETVDRIPIAKPVKGLIHLALNDKGNGHPQNAPTRTFAVLGDLGDRDGWSAAAPFVAGVAEGATHPFTSGNQSLQHQRFSSRHNTDPLLASDRRRGIFDVCALSFGDAAVALDGTFERSSHKTTRVFRIEGQTDFFTTPRLRFHSRLVLGLGGSIIESPNVIKLVGLTAPAVMYMSVDDDYRPATDNAAQRMLQYSKVVQRKSQHDLQYDRALRPVAAQFKIKSYRIFTNDPERMFRDIQDDDDGHPANDVRRVDITKASTSFECWDPVYTPVLQPSVPDSYSELQPPWLTHVPSTLLGAMSDKPLAYGHIRSFVLPGTRFSKASLRADVAEAISYEDLKRLEQGLIPLSVLSQDGINSIELRQERVRRLRQSREVKCGRTLAGDVDHGRYTEYLAEFGDNSTSWIPSYDVAQDLKEEFWTVMTTRAQEVTEIVRTDSARGKVTVRRPDGYVDVVGREQLYWQREREPTRLTDAELDAILYHGHFGHLNPFRLMHCTTEINTDWWKVKLPGRGAVFKKDPEAERAGMYTNVQFSPQSISFGERHCYKFVEQQIPFLIVHNGSLIDVKVTHGADGKKLRDRQGRVALICDPEERLESMVNPADSGFNPSSFQIRPSIVTPALFTLKSDVGAVEVTSSSTTLAPDPTADQRIYEKADFSNKRMGFAPRIFGQEFVVP